MLAPKGIIVAVMNGGWETKTQKPYVDFRRWLDDKISDYEYISGGTFDTTKISTRLVCIEKANPLLREYEGWESHYAWEWHLCDTTTKD
jgi:hypothetical protein